MKKYIILFIFSSVFITGTAIAKIDDAKGIQKKIPVEITNINVNVATTTSSTSHVFSWETNKIADAKVTYWIGTTTSTSTIDISTTTLSILHNIETSNLSTSTIYSFFVTSKDVYGNVATSSIYYLNKSPFIRLQEVLNDTNLKAIVDYVVSEINPFEINYYIQNGGLTYWQGLQTHDLIPEFTNPTAPTNLDDRAGDSSISWRETNINLPELLPFSVSVDVFGAPVQFCPLEPNGFSIRLKTTNGGSIFTKIISDSNCSEKPQPHDWE